MHAAGITQAVICGNSASRRIRQKLGDGTGLGLELSYYEDWTPRGPAGCIRDCAAHAEVDRLVVADGAIIPVGCDLPKLLRQHIELGAAITVAASRDTESLNPTKERLVPAGIYVVESSVLQHVPETGYQDVKEVLLPRLHQKGLLVRPHRLPAPIPRVTDATSYLALHAWMLERILAGEQTPDGYRLVGRSLVHESGRGVTRRQARRHGSGRAGHANRAGCRHRRPRPPIGAHCVIESQAVVSRSVLWDRCHHRARCDDRSLRSRRRRPDPGQRDALPYGVE